MVWIHSQQEPNSHYSFLTSRKRMEKIELKVITVSASQSQSGTYALILDEKTGNRRIPIIIGPYEAQAIVIELENMKPQRPLTHDLFKTFSISHGITISEVIIHNFANGVFYAELYTQDSDGNVVVIDARTSDAVAIALRFRCPIYTNESVLSQAGVLLNPDPELEEEDLSEAMDEEPQPGKMEDIDLEKLRQMLEEAVGKEHYELASKIRDEINRRKNTL